MVSIFFIFPLLGVLISHRFREKFIDLSLLMLFSGGFLLTINLTGILPHAVENSTSVIWLFVALGYIIQMVLDVFSKGVEHGHVHKDQKVSIGPLYSALFLHAAIEGMPLALLADQKITIWNYFIGLAMHEVPAAFILAYLMYKNQLPKFQYWILLLLYGFAIPLGYLIGTFLMEMHFYNDHIRSIVLALCAGILLHIATTVITENFKYHSFNKRKWVAFSLGLLVALISLFSHHLID